MWGRFLITTEIDDIIKSYSIKLRNGITDLSKVFLKYTVSVILNEKSIFSILMP